MSAEEYLKSVLNDWHQPAGYIKEWSLAFFGTHGTRHDRTSIHAVKEQKAYKPTEKDVLDLKKKEIEISKRVQVKRSNKVSKKTSNKAEKDEDSKESKLMADLWDALHGNGGREVKKRVYNLNSITLSPDAQLKHKKKNVEEMSRRELVNEILRLLDEIDANKKR